MRSEWGTRAERVAYSRARPSSTGAGRLPDLSSAITEQHRNEQDSNAEKHNNGHGCRYAPISPWFGRALIPVVGRWHVRASGHRVAATGSPALSLSKGPVFRQAWIACGFLIDLLIPVASSEAPSVTAGPPRSNDCALPAAPDCRPQPHRWTGLRIGREHVQDQGVSGPQRCGGGIAQRPHDGAMRWSSRWCQTVEHLPSRLYNVAPRASEAKFASLPLRLRERDRPACRGSSRSRSGRIAQRVRNPKSLINAVPSSAIRTLPGLTSRWTMPTAWAAASADAILPHLRCFIQLQRSDLLRYLSVMEGMNCMISHNWLLLDHIEHRHSVRMLESRGESRLTHRPFVGEFSFCC